MRRSPLLASIVSCSVLTAGCNLITGADDIEVEDGAGGNDGPAGPGSGAGSPGSGGSTAATGDGGGATTGSNTGSTSTGEPCATACGANEHCDGQTGTCVCDPGFVDQGGACAAVDPGDPSLRTADEVCNRWASDHVITEPDPLITTGADCDSGTLKQGALDDTLVRINLFRWLSGLGPTSDDPALNAIDQKCANLESWWDFSLPQSPHAPPTTVKCYTAEGAQGAGMSNIAWGNGPADSIDQYVEDSGNETTMGHRRWIVNPPLGPVGIGYWEGGGMYGSAQCLAVFGSSGQGPNPAWVAVPNQGFTPLTVASWTWTFSSDIAGVPTADIAVVRVDDNTSLPVNVIELQQGFAQGAISWEPMGWTVEANKTYRVTVSGLTSGDVTYDVKPVACN
jgi:predicted small secreted protein